MLHTPARRARPETLWHSPQVLAKALRRLREKALFILPHRLIEINETDAERDGFFSAKLRLS